MNTFRYNNLIFRFNSGHNFPKQLQSHETIEGMSY